MINGLQELRAFEEANISIQKALDDLASKITTLNTGNEFNMTSIKNESKKWKPELQDVLNRVTKAALKTINDAHERNG